MTRSSMTEQARMEASAEKARVEELLNAVLPAAITDELRENGKVRPRYIRSATILFADFQGFTRISSQVAALDS